EHLCADFDSEVSRFSLVGLSDSALIECVTNSLENIRAVRQEPFNAQVAAGFFIGGCQKNNVVLRRSTTMSSLDERRELTDGDSFHVERTAAIKAVQVD